MGLAGGILINDEEESRLGLPSVNTQIPLVLQDRMFDSNNQLVYVRNMMDRMTGVLWLTISWSMVVPDMTLDVASRAYRLRVMNGSNARIYKLGWDDGTPDYRHRCRWRFAGKASDSSLCDAGSR
jgi:FtsP/CotA-like multicopper oxidase with cupredoxin domain